MQGLESWLNVRQGSESLPMLSFQVILNKAIYQKCTSNDMDNHYGKDFVWEAGPVPPSVACSLVCMSLEEGCVLSTSTTGTP